MESQTASQDQEVKDTGQPHSILSGEGKALEKDREKQNRRRFWHVAVCHEGYPAKEEGPK